MSKKDTRIYIDLLYDHTESCWYAKSDYFFGEEREDNRLYCYNYSKYDAVSVIIDHICEALLHLPLKFSLRIYTKRGTFEKERTYPRRTDPKRSKG